MRTVRLQEKANDIRPREGEKDPEQICTLYCEEASIKPVSPGGHQGSSGGQFGWNFDDAFGLTKSLGVEFTVEQLDIVTS